MDKEEEARKQRNFRIENPFEDNLDESRYQTSKINDSKELHLQIKNKIVYTNQGWGISDNVRKNINMGTHSNLTTPKNPEKQEKNIQGVAREKAALRRNPSGKIITPVKKSKNQSIDNNRIIYTDRHHNLKSSNAKSTKGWMGENDNESDSSEGWVETKGKISGGNRKKK